MDTIKKGDFVRIPTKNEGHDHHDPKKAYKVTHVYGNGESFMLEHSTAIWPKSRLRKV